MVLMLQFGRQVHPPAKNSRPNKAEETSLLKARAWKMRLAGHSKKNTARAHQTEQTEQSIQQRLN